MSWKMYSNTKAGLTLDRVRATKYMFKCRVYKNEQFSMRLIGDSVPVSLAATTCKRNESAAVRPTSSLHNQRIVDKRQGEEMRKIQHFRARLTHRYCREIIMSPF
jgi:uncharacterized protein YutE (UPF0331/DUF86 family)